jgi:hypothetical protein
MWRILSLSILLALTNGTSVFAHERLAGRHSPPELWRQLAQAAPPQPLTSGRWARPDPRRCASACSKPSSGSDATKDLSTAKPRLPTSKPCKPTPPTGVWSSGRLKPRQRSSAASNMHWPRLERSRPGRPAVRELSRGRDSRCLGYRLHQARAIFGDDKPGGLAGRCPVFGDATCK